MKTSLAEAMVYTTDCGLTYDDVNIYPKYSKSYSRKEIGTETRLVGDIFISNPLIPANMDSICEIDMVMEAYSNGSIGFMHRFNNKSYYAMIEKIALNLPYIPLTIGTKKEDLDIVKYVSELSSVRNHLKTIVVLIDVAHGDHILVKGQIYRLKELRKKCLSKIFIIAGNVATYNGAYNLCSWGADGIKVGIGPGSLCTTRLNTGAGVPQFSAIAEARLAIDDYLDGCNSDALNPYGVTIIADGGIKHYGDIVKAIGAGANSVMSGYLFAGTDKTPGKLTYINGVPHKQYRGSASRESKIDRGEDGNIEGVSIDIPFGGLTADVFKSALDGIRSGLSYAGMSSVDEAIGRIQFCMVSTSSIREAGPHARKE